MSKRKTAVTVLLALLLLLILSLTGCASDSGICYYAYFENSAYSLIYKKGSNSFYCIQLPLEQILLWGKSSGMDSITTAMRNYVGLNDRGFLLGSADSLQALKDMLDIMGSESTEEPSAAKRAATMVDKAPVLSKKPLSDKINQLCGQDAEGLMKLLEGANNPSVSCYDAQGIFTTDDLNFSQRYFSQWLEQVLGGTI